MIRLNFELSNFKLRSFSLEHTPLLGNDEEEVAELFVSDVTIACLVHCVPSLDEQLFVEGFSIWVASGNLLVQMPGHLVDLLFVQEATVLMVKFFENLFNDF
jgi:hypothetical protein